MVTRRMQNRVAESRFTLPAVVAYAVVVWLATGLLIPHVPFTMADLRGGAWLQLVCFALATYLMIEQNNGNALIRIYSRTVSCAFLILSCAACFLFQSVEGVVVQLCMAAYLTVIFHTYQDKQSAGWTFYAFLCIGLASLVFVQILWLVPFFWLLNRFQLNSLSWRTFFASVVGLLTPYWFATVWIIFKQAFDLPARHFARLADFQFPYDYHQLTVNQVATFAFIVMLGVTGIIHYIRNSSGDKIRIRQIYGYFIALMLIATTFIVLQPQYYTVLLGLLIVNVAPLIAHFVSLTYTKITNIAFYVICTAAVLLTLLNLWMPSLNF